MNILTETANQTTEIINVNRLNIMLIGPSEGGKTSLINSLNQNFHNSKYRETYKHSIYQNAITIGNDIFGTIIDTSGNINLKHVQRLLHNKSTLYILMLNPHLLKNRQNYINDVKKYYDFITNYSKDSVVILVINNSQTIQINDILHEINDILSHCKNLNYDDIISVDFAADHNDSEHGIYKIINKLKQITSDDKHDFFKYQVPNYYLDLEHEIKLLKYTKKVITFEEFKEFCKQKLPSIEMSESDHEKILKTFCSWHTIYWVEKINQIYLNPQDLFDMIALFIYNKYSVSAYRSISEFTYEEFKNILNDNNYDDSTILKFKNFLCYKKLMYDNNNKIVFPCMKTPVAKFESLTFNINYLNNITDAICEFYEILQNIKLDVAHTVCLTIQFNFFPCDFFSYFSTTFVDCIIDSTHYANAFVIEKKYYDQTNKKFIQSYCCVITTYNIILFVNFGESYCAIDHAINNFVNFTFEHYHNSISKLHYQYLIGDKIIGKTNFNNLIEENIDYVRLCDECYDISLIIKHAILLNTLINEKKQHNIADDYLKPTMFEINEMSILNQLISTFENLNMICQNDLFPNHNTQSFVDKPNCLVKYYSDFNNCVDLTSDIVKLYYKYCLKIENYDPSVLYVLCKTKVDSKYYLANIYFDKTTSKMAIKMIDNLIMNINELSFTQTSNEIQLNDIQFVWNLFYELLTKIYKIYTIDEFNNIAFVNVFPNNISINLNNIEGDLFGYDSIKNMIDLEIQSLQMYFEYDKIILLNKNIKKYINQIKKNNITISMLNNIKNEIENIKLIKNFTNFNAMIVDLIKNNIEYTDNVNNLKQTELIKLKEEIQQNISNNYICLTDDELQIINFVNKHIEKFKSIKEIDSEATNKITNIVNSNVDDDHQDKLNLIIQISKQTQQNILKKINKSENHDHLETLTHIQNLQLINEKIKLKILINDIADFALEFINLW